MGPHDVVFSMPGKDEVISEGYFHEGEAVVYHSRTQSAYLRTRITKIHILAGVVQAIDLSCKKSADLSKIAKIQETGADPWREKVLAELPLPLHAENVEVERRRADTVNGAVVDGDRNGVTGSKVLQKGRPETQGPRFKVGDKVLYESRTLNQKVIAVVEGITPDGFYDLNVKKAADPKNIYPYLGEPPSAQEDVPLQPLRAESLTPHGNGVPPMVFADTAADFVGSRQGEARVLSCRISAVPLGQVLAESPLADAGYDDGARNGSQVRRSDLPSPGAARFNIGDKVFYNSRTLNQKVIAIIEGITSDGFYDLDVKKSADPRNISPYLESPDCSPFALGAAEFVASRYTGEGRIVNCKAFPAIPVGPQAPSPHTRTPTPVRAAGSTPRVCAVPKAPSPAVAEMIKRLGGELRCPSTFKPANAMIRQQLLQHLGLSDGAQIKEMGGFKGGLNQGIWIVSDGDGPQLVLKQSRCQRIASGILTEAENFVRILKDHPEIAFDPLIAFPVKILGCTGPEGKISDIIVMKMCPGKRLCEFVAAKFYANQMQQLNNALEEVGHCLAQFHFRYGHEQHGDFQPSNIYYEERTNVVTFIDVGGMGVPTMGTDVDHFHHCIRAMTASYHENLHAELLQAFDKGYQSATPDSKRGISVHFDDSKLPTDGYRFGNLTLDQP